MGQPRKILYIEDNPANYHLVERLLRGEGFNVLHARDGFTGIQTAIEERHDLDLILMDVHMPGMDGYEAATKLKTLEGFDTIPIVAVTVNRMESDRKRLLVAGCDGYIPKPIDIHTFPQRVRDYIRGRREHIRASEEGFYLREHARRLVDRLESKIGQLRVTHEQIRHRDKLASLGEMAAGVAHELNNPLSSIAFAIHQLLRHTPEDSKQFRNLELVERNVERIRSLADGLTSFARPSDAERDRVDLPAALDQVLVLSEHELRTRGIKIFRDIPDFVPPVWASESHLQHVFLNLIRNAAQAIGSEERERPGQINLRVADGSDGYVRIDLADNGAGINPEFQDRLFTPFFTTKPRGEGTGLGLYIVKEMVDDLGGRIDLQSTVGEGTTFSIHLPKGTPDQGTV